MFNALWDANVLEIHTYAENQETFYKWSLPTPDKCKNFIYVLKQRSAFNEVNGNWALGISKELKNICF